MDPFTCILFNFHSSIQCETLIPTSYTNKNDLALYVLLKIGEATFIKVTLIVILRPFLRRFKLCSLRLLNQTLTTKTRLSFKFHTYIHVCVCVSARAHNIYTLDAYIKGSLVCLSFIYGIGKEKKLKYETKTCDKKQRKLNI